MGLIQIAIGVIIGAKVTLSLSLSLSPYIIFNFIYLYGCRCQGGSDHNPCSDTYCGARAFSEIEVKGVSDYLSKASDIICYINFHSYSQLWMSPYGYTTKKPANYTLQVSKTPKETDLNIFSMIRTMVQLKLFLRFIHSIKHNTNTGILPKQFVNYNYN